MTFEGKVEVLILVFNILYADTTFYRADGKASIIMEAGNSTSLPFQRRLNGLSNFNVNIKVRM